MTVEATFADFNFDTGTVQVDPWGWEYDGNYDSIVNYFEEIDEGYYDPGETPPEAGDWEVSPSQKLTMAMMSLGNVRGVIAWSYGEGVEPDYF
jgi:hypothetical protein